MICDVSGDLEWLVEAKEYSDNLINQIRKRLRNKDGDELVREIKISMYFLTVSLKSVVIAGFEDEHHQSVFDDINKYMRLPCEEKISARSDCK